MRDGPTKICHNAGWYNKAGEKLGFGDLNAKDFERILTELEIDELFILLEETASFGNFVTKPGITGSLSETDPTIDAPGVEYVAEHAAFVVAPGVLYYIDRSDRDDPEERSGLTFNPLEKPVLKELMLG